jgi:hypothetical protein
MATVNATVSGATTYKYSLYRKESGMFVQLMAESTTIPFTFTPYPGTNTYVLVTEGNEGSCIDISGDISLTCESCNITASTPTYICNQNGTYNASFLVSGGSGNFTYNGNSLPVGFAYEATNLSSGIHIVNVVDVETSCTLTVTLNHTCTVGSCNFETNDAGIFTVTKVLDFTAVGATTFDIGFNSVSVPDRILIVKNGLPHFDSGCVGYSSSCVNNANCINATGSPVIKGYTFSIANGDHLEIYLDGTCSQNSSTCWGFKALCNNNQLPFTVTASSCNSTGTVSTFQPITLSPLTKTFTTFFTSVTQQILGLERVIKFQNQNAPSIGRIPEYGIVYENSQSSTFPSQWGFVYGESGSAASARIRTLPNNNGGIATPGSFTGFTLWVRDYLDHTAMQSAHYTFI